MCVRSFVRLLWAHEWCVNAKVVFKLAPDKNHSAVLRVRDKIQWNKKNIDRIAASNLPSLAV